MYLWIKKIFGDFYSFIPASLRWAPEFNKIMKMLLESENWDKNESEIFQFEKTKAIIKYAEDYVPWYKSKFAEWGVSSGQFKEISDIKKFPIVTKEEIRDNLDQFVSIKSDKKKLIYLTTGGSTGIPFGFYQSKSLLYIENIFFTYNWNWYGCKHQIDKSVVLRGSYVGDNKNLFAYFPKTNEWHFSTYYLTEKNFDKYFENLNLIKPKFIQAYPSAVEIFARYMVDHNKKLDFKLDAIMCGSENLYPGQKELIEKTFNTKIHAWYGQAEKVCLAVWKKDKQFYHVLPQYGLTELINDNGDDIIEENGIGEIVSTSFYNFDMPFIRYRTMDTATIAYQNSTNNYQMFSKINGRIQELFVTSSGRLISMTAINMHDNIFDELKQFQFYQDTPGELIMNVIPRNNLSEESINIIKNRLVNKIGKDVKFQIKIVKEIARTKSGKLRFLIQKIPIKHNGIIKEI